MSIVATMAENPAKAEKLKTVCICLHCGNRFGGDANGKCALTCKNCRTEEARNAQCSEGIDIFKEAGMEWHCKHCNV